MDVILRNFRLCLLCFAICPIHILSQIFESNMDSSDTQIGPQTDDKTTPALTKNEMYRDLIHLTNDNFTEIVLKAKDPWIVVFHDGNIFKPWKAMAANVRGIIWMGLVHTDDIKVLDNLVSVYRRVNLKIMCTIKTSTWKVPYSPLLYCKL